MQERRVRDCLSPAAIKGLEIMENLVFSLSAYRQAAYGRTLNRPFFTATLLEVLQRYADGGTCQTIAEDKGRAVDTIKHQCQQISDVLAAFAAYLRRSSTLGRITPVGGWRDEDRPQ